ncbi:Putative alkyl hydroperoxide reductase subunit C/ Thiol specific antioxidant [Septoria linicola]|uniref:Alkyl hydroperoxide reductase subunit C/ Thiol specific antioxidant n=1 Tax=Septoria linicola TaxID=215465 RepID=A0A9Q9EJZ0_9PEZI|nr:putative alkyl hydroperoxide reductase subunit C/ Thiol specific antioxidant [Septoria linicola]USW53535.1 Putative alkyl hydroperoxide reductase subunit C/ Thiol specific antioxidant [Septoria linicola]
MTYQQEFNSWFAPKNGPASAEPPKVGEKAPQPSKLELQTGKRTVIAFLRHCGCPFAEKTYLRLREAAKTHRDIDFVAVSHSGQDSTDKWVKSIPQYGSEPSNLRLVVDDKKEAYAAYGLGISSWLHVLSPASMMNVFSLARKEGISNRPTESGTRWQTSGTYAIGEDGKVKWGGPASRADDVPDFEQIVQYLSASSQSKL